MKNSKEYFPFIHLEAHREEQPPWWTVVVDINNINNEQDCDLALQFSLQDGLSHTRCHFAGLHATSMGS